MTENKIITFGCRLNSFESEIIRNAANQSDLTNAIIFNTCAVTQEAERQAKQAIRKASKEFPDKKIIVTGCAAQLNPEKYSIMPEVSKVLGNEEKLQAKFYIMDDEKIQVNDIMSIKETASHLITNLEGKTRAFVQIQNGCNHRCTFCTIPFARGNNRSVPVGLIVNQIKTLIENGYNEIVLTGVDISDYGKDLPATPSLAQMTKRMLTLIPELKRLRFSSIDVAEIDNELLELFINEPRIMPHFHISMQAGDNMILKRMKRRHSREQVIEFCHIVKSRRPESAFGADIIAGFPTETDEMFENTRRIISEAGIPYLHVFPFSARENTPASKMAQIPKSIRKERATILRLEGEKQLQLHLQGMIGKNVEAIVESKNMARSENFSHISLAVDCNPGDIIKLKITSLNENILQGELI
jgi:threonylcarbamoyladenosine tRNA methylthiotransferase MtaB